MVKSAKSSKNGSKQQFELVLEQVAAPRPSSTGKSEVQYTTGGFQPTAMQTADGRPISVSITLTAPLPSE